MSSAVRCSVPTVNRLADSDLDAQVAAAAAVVRDVLGDDALATYLLGSAAAGQLRPTSDVDLLVVSRRPTSPEEKRRLVDGFTRISAGANRPATWRPLDVTVVVASKIRPWRDHPRIDFQYGEWLRANFEAGDVEPSATSNPDLAVRLTAVRQGARPVFGPAPRELIDPVPSAQLIEAVQAGIEPLLDDLESDTRNVLLTLARIWITTATGRIVSKDEAAEWAMQRLPEDHRSMLARARDEYLSSEEYESWADVTALAQELADRLVHEIRHGP